MSKGKKKVVKLLIKITRVDNIDKVIYFIYKLRGFFNHQFENKKSYKIKIYDRIK